MTCCVLYFRATPPIITLAMINNRLQYFPATTIAKHISPVWLRISLFLSFSVIKNYYISRLTINVLSLLWFHRCHQTSTLF
jgi:hypothetical protein